MNSAASPIPKNPRGPLICTFLVVATFLIYAPWQPREFIGWDDTSYIRDNPHVTAVDGFQRIWTTLEDDQYYPLTFASYWLEYRLWGAWPTGYYLTNVLLHCAASVLVFRLARRLLILGTGGSEAHLSVATDLAAAFVAALFALHPTNVASVAWLAQRKNTLSGVLALASVLAYLAYLRDARRYRYFTALGLFAAALLAKTAVMTIPASLLLADALFFHRPLRRAIQAAAPFFALAIGLAAVTFIREHAGSTYAEPLPMRPIAAAEAFWFYLFKIIWPNPLVAVYPKWNVAASPLGLLSLAGVLAFLGGAWLWRNRFGNPAVWGMLHFAITLAPILGLVSFGLLEQAQVADHYLYLAAPGVFIAIAVLALGICSNKQSRLVLAVGAAGILLLLGRLTTLNIALWRTGPALFDHVLKFNPDSAIAHQVLAWNAVQTGQLGPAETHYVHALKSRPQDASLRSDYGMVLLNLGRTDEAIDQLRQSLSLTPNNANAQFNLGAAYGTLGRYSEAAAAFHEGARLDPQNARGHLNLAIALNALNRPSAAEPEFAAARRLAPTDALVCAEFASALAGWNRMPEARELAQAGLLLAEKSGQVELQSRLADDLKRWFKMKPP